MTRDSRFTFLCDEKERRAIGDLAAQLQRSQSDAVRFVVVEATKQLAQAALITISALPAEEPGQTEGGMNVKG
jgi:hypothetical protein